MIYSRCAVLLAAVWETADAAGGYPKNADTRSRLQSRAVSSRLGRPCNRRRLVSSRNLRLSSSSSSATRTHAVRLEPICTDPIYAPYGGRHSSSLSISTTAPVGSSTSRSETLLLLLTSQFLSIYSYRYCALSFCVCVCVWRGKHPEKCKC